jgi:hypothetical protein
MGPPSVELYGRLAWTAFSFALFNIIFLVVLYCIIHQRCYKRSSCYMDKTVTGRNRLGRWLKYVFWWGWLEWRKEDEENQAGNPSTGDGSAGMDPNVAVNPGPTPGNTNQQPSAASNTVTLGKANQQTSAAPRPTKRPDNTGMGPAKLEDVRRLPRDVGTPTTSLNEPAVGPSDSSNKESSRRSRS